MPFESTSECSVLSAGTVKIGVRAAISHWWFRNEPPNAAWNMLSRIA